MHATTIVGYTYDADNYCPDCVKQAFMFHANEAGRGAEFAGKDLEELLDWCADQLDLDRYNESNFDSSDFPKVIFCSQLEDDESCGGCHEPLA